MKRGGITQFHLQGASLILDLNHARKFSIKFFGGNFLVNFLTNNDIVFIT